LFDEPINASANVVFLLAAWAAWRLGVRHRALSAGLWVLIGLSISVGVGSALWHTFATSWALVLDVVPILSFQLVFLWLYGRKVANLHAIPLITILIGYVGIEFWMREYREWLNGGMMYVPSLVLAWAVGLHYYLIGRRDRLILLTSAAVFCAALTCRSIDLVICRQLPIGTHFLWHVLNGLVVYLAMRALVVAGADHPATVVLSRFAKVQADPVE
jgi:hypothetical protein